MTRSDDREPGEVLRTLLAGNRRMTSTAAELRRISQPGPPLAALLCCSEVCAPERLFGCAPDELYVLQGAGVTPGHSVLAGVAHAVLAVDVALVLVMAHTRCALGRDVGDSGSPRPAGWAAARCVAHLEREPELGPLLKRRGVDVIPLLLDDRTGRVRLIC